MKPLVRIVLCLWGSMMPLVTAQAGWTDWWLTPEQQAARAFAAGDHETLTLDAPDAGWAGLGQYQAGDYTGAAESFRDQARKLQEQGEDKAANRMRYNQGVSEVRSGQYDEAIRQFDTVLEADPAFEDALRNREIAEQLRALAEQQEQPGDQQQEQQEEQQGDQQGEPQAEQQGDQQGEPQEAQQGDQQGDQQGEPQEEQQSDDASAGNGRESGDGGSEKGDESAMSERSDREEQEAAEAARRALAAESARQQESSRDNTAKEPANNGSAAAVERPLSESEQATEQLLRRIPDDPAGLLRRKLEQSHRSEYPEVRDADQPW